MVSRVQNHITRNWLIGCGGISSLGVIVIIAGAVVGFFTIPEVNQQMPVSLNPLFVAVTQPPNGATLPLNQATSVYVEAFGDQPIQDIQLLVDGVPLPNPSSSPGRRQEDDRLLGMDAGKKGIHVLVASAKTQNGRGGISNAVNIKALAQDQMPLPLALNGLAEVTVLSDQAEQVPEPEGTPTAPPPGFNDQGGPINPPPPPPEPGNQEPPPEPAQQPADNLIPIKYSLWAQNLTKNLFGVDQPAAPKLDGGANQCEGILVVQVNYSDELGFFLYRLGPGKNGFERVATLDGKPGKSTFSYHDPGLTQGSYSYYLSSFNAAGEAPGNIITFQITGAQCANATPQAIIFDSLKMKTTTPVDQVYCYISADGSPWKRIPAGQNSFIQATNGEFDLNPYLGSLPLPKPPKTQITIDIECWGWNGGTLTSLGSSKQSWEPKNEFMLSSQFFQINGKGSGPNPWPDPGEPTNLIAPPYNAYMTNDPNDCATHTPPAHQGQCEQWIIQFGYSLAWTYNRFGDCNPQTDTCDPNLQPQEAFRIYRVHNGVTEEWPLYPNPPLSTYVPVQASSENDEFFVRAYSTSLGESGDSNHVSIPKQVLESIIDPTYIITTRWNQQNYDNVASHWDTVYWNAPDQVTTGYAFTCLNKCSDGKFQDYWYNGMVQFNFPQAIAIQDAQLNWNTKGYTADGPGKNDVFWNCGVKLSTDFGGPALNSMPFQGYGNFDVSKPLIQAELLGHNMIKFWFLAPSKNPGATRWDRCLWDLNNLSLTLHYNQ